MCLPLMESEQEFLYQFFVRNVLPLNELNSKKLLTIQKNFAIITHVEKIIILVQMVVK